MTSSVVRACSKKDRHSVRWRSMGSGFSRGGTLPTMSSWLMLYVSMLSSLPSAVRSLPERLYLSSFQF